MITTEGELNGVAKLLARVVDEKLEIPDKKRIFDRLDFVLSVHVTDMGQSASVEFRRGEAVVTRGLPGGSGARKPDLAVECDNATFIQFTMLRLHRPGVPDLFDDNARAIVHKLVTRRLVIRGPVRHLPALYRFLCLVAAAPDED